MKLRSRRRKPEGRIEDLLVTLLPRYAEGGKTYINIHTMANKGGEIRGQITK